jgi:hypothetical protein
LSKVQDRYQKGTPQVKPNRCRPSLKVTVGGRGVVGHAGARLLVDLADTLGLGDELSSAMAPTKTRRRGHDRGWVLVDLAVALADGAETISDLANTRACLPSSLRSSKGAPAAVDNFPDTPAA